MALKVAEPLRVLVPRKAITELGRLLEGEESVTFQQVESHLVFSVGGRTLASKLVEAQFPAFEKVIAASGDKTVELDREALQSAIRRVSLLSSERSRAVKLTLATGKLELAASSPDLGEARESIAVDFKGETVEIGFNAQYLVDFLGVGGHGDGRPVPEGRRDPGAAAPGGGGRDGLPLHRHAHEVLGVGLGARPRGLRSAQHPPRRGWISIPA